MILYYHLLDIMITEALETHRYGGHVIDKPTLRIKPPYTNNIKVMLNVIYFRI